jgi:small subunit ribosomal protein S16
MLKIRLQKVGKKNAPSYRVVLAEHTSPPQGKFIEILGHYNPRLKEKKFKKERIDYWLAKGAQSSPTVHNLLIDAKIIEGEKLKAWKAKKRKQVADKVVKEAPTPAEGEVGVPIPPSAEDVGKKPEEKPEEKTEERVDKPEKID